MKMTRTNENCHITLTEKELRDIISVLHMANLYFEDLEVGASTTGDVTIELIEKLQQSLTDMLKDFYSNADSR